MTTTDAFRAVPDGVRLQLRVMPRSPRTAIGGVRDGRLVVRVTAPPVDHAANEAVVMAIAEFLAVPRRFVRVVAGQTSRNKTVEVEGSTVEAVEAALGAENRTPRRGT